MAALGNIITKLKASAKEKEEIRRKLAVTAKQLAAVAKEKEEIRKKLVVTTAAAAAERALTAEKLAHVEKLAAIGKLAAILIHELRNPLSVIQNSIFSLSLSLSNTENERIQKSLKRLKEEAMRMDKVVRDVLEFSRTERLHKIQEDLGEMIKESLTGVVVPKNIKVNIKLDKLPLIRAYKMQLMQAFHNIITNAVEAMPKGGKLTITTSKADDYAEVGIQDTGIGIAKENFNRIFDLLFSTKPKNSGLGLKISQQIIESHGGSIDFESEVGKGTKFIVKLPLAQLTQKVGNKS